MSEAVDFLRGYLPSGPWTVVADRESTGKRGWVCRQFLTSEVEDLEEFITLNDGHNNLYFTVNLARLGLPTSPEVEDMTHLLGIPLDVDLPVGYSAEDLDRLIDRVQGVKPPPTATVFSGGGIQAHWCLNEMKPLSFAKAVSDLVLALATEFGGDHIQNINRLMRLPGTTNVLNSKKRALGREPARSYLIEADWARRYEATGTFNVPPPIIVLRPVDELESEWQERIRTGSVAWLNGKDKSRSAAVWSIVLYLVRSSWDDESIVAVLTDRDLGVSIHIYHQGNPERYARRQVRNARLSVENDYVRNKATKAIIATRMDNVEKALAQMNVSLFYDEFGGKLQWVNGEDRGAKMLDDFSINYLRYTILHNAGFQPTKDLVYDTCTVVARDAIVNPIKEYLEPIVWDGQERLETWLIRHGGAQDDAYVRAVSKIILVAAVTRVYRPGVKFDEMLILENPTQGTDKSGAIRALCPDEDWFSDSLTLNAAGRETIEGLAGKWIVEVQELSGMRQRDVEHLKAFLSRGVDRGRMAYDRATTESHRTCVLFGTTNSTRYLRDEQNRRFWPVAVGRVDSEAVLAERDQLWAEALHAFRSGFSIRLPRELWELASFEQESRRVADPWLYDLDNALTDQTGRILTVDIYKVLGLHRSPGVRHQEADSRVGTAMRELGWERVKARMSGRNCWVYAKGTPQERARILYAQFDPITNETTIVELQKADVGPTADPDIVEPTIYDPNEVPF